MIVKLFEDGKLYQTNKGDITGNIWASWNLDLISNPGRIRVSPQTDVVMSDNTGFTGYDSDFGLPTCFCVSNADSSMRMWAVAGGVLFKTPRQTLISSVTPQDTWTQDANTGTPTCEGDILEFNGSLIAILQTSVSRLNAPAVWTSDWLKSAPTNLELGERQHPACVSFNNLLLIGNGNNLVSVNTSDSVDLTAVVLPEEFEIRWIRSSNSTIFIGTYNRKGGNAKIFTWDGYSENFNGDYKINGGYSIAGVIKDEICYSINEIGELLAFNGGNFVQVAVFPFFGQGDITFSNTSARNCMVVRNDNIYILVSQELSNTGTDTPVHERLRGGIWCYNKENGLHHAISLTKAINSNVTDYGSPAIDEVGALASFPYPINCMVAGAKIRVNASDSSSAFALSTTAVEYNTTSKIGYFITPKIQTKEIEEHWQRIWLLIKPLLNATDKIIIKYRTDKEVLMESWAVGLWSTTNVFTSTDADLSVVEAGDEVEIFDGEGSGLSTKIASITDLAGTYTITISDYVTGASSYNKFVVWNWSDVGEDIATQGLRNFERAIDKNSSWIQFKVVMFFKGKNEVEQLIIKSDKQLSVV